MAAFVGFILLGAAFLFLASGHYSIGEFTWWQYPAGAPHPWFERISYKGKTLYTGFGESAVDLDMSRSGLITIFRYYGSGENFFRSEIYYDARRECFVDEKTAHRNYEYERRYGDALGCTYYTLCRQDLCPKPLLIRRLKELGK